MTSARSTTGHRVGVMPGGQGFDCPSGRTILSAGLEAGLNLPYECASGGCGTCRARLVEGSVQPVWAGATGLSTRDRRKRDRILTCQSVPDTDCTLRVTVDQPAHNTPFVRHRAEVIELAALSGNTRRVVLDVPLEYLAGQFVIIEFVDGTRRAYSMSAPPGAPQLEFVVKAKPGGAATDWLFNRLTPGDQVLVEGPYGKAYLRPGETRPILCIAGGSGLGPMLAIAEQAIGRDPNRSLALYYGSRTQEDAVLPWRLESICQAPGATVIVVVERDPKPEQIGGIVGDVVVANHPTLLDHDIYMAGPVGMVDACLTDLVRSGRAAADRVWFDRFQ